MRCLVPDSLAAGFVVVLAMAALSLPAATESLEQPVAPKWSRYEQAFTSTVDYGNPLQETTLKVVFTAPTGETREVFGFWDGGRTWRVRFAPDTVGRWTFTTFCSDTGNTGLHHQSGGFLCTASLGQTRFRRHGAVRVARGGTHFEHLDGTPFFCLADTAWRGGVVSSLTEWETYAQTRSLQGGFSAVLWGATPGTDPEGRSGITGFPESAGVNPDYFQRLDQKIEALRQAGLVSCIAPIYEFPESPDPGAKLHQDQVALIVRYMMARWSADPVIWILPCEGTEAEALEAAALWRYAGGANFGKGSQAPVLVYTSSPKAWEQMSALSWVDAGALPAPAFANLPNQPQPKPLLAILPAENTVSPDDARRILAEDVRGQLYSALLSGQIAGFGYSANGLPVWNSKVDDDGYPFWRKVLFMPGAKQVSLAGRIAEKVHFWKLAPAESLLAEDSRNIGVWISASPKEDALLAYVPVGASLVLRSALPADAKASWYNAQTSQLAPVVPVEEAGKWRFTPPEAGSWIFVSRPE